MSDPNRSRYRYSIDVFDGLISSIRETFQNHGTSGAIHQEQQSVLEKSKSETPDPRITRNQQAAAASSENIPACPCCNARMDEFGYWFASKMTVDGRIYYCNNPMCNGGHAKSQRRS